MHIHAIYEQVKANTKPVAAVFEIAPAWTGTVLRNTREPRGTLAPLSTALAVIPAAMDPLSASYTGTSIARSLLVTTVPRVSRPCEHPGTDINRPQLQDILAGHIAHGCIQIDPLRT